MHTSQNTDDQSLSSHPVYILVGGQSRRMGRPKALLPFPEVPLLLVLIDRLRLAFRHIYVVCSPAVTSSAAFGELQKALSDCSLHNHVLVDPISDGGPLGGLACAAEYTRRLGYPRYLVIPCDMPFLTTTFLTRLVSTHPTAPAVVPITADGRPTGVCAAYNINIQPTLLAFLCRGGRRVQDFLQMISAVPLSFSDYADLPNADQLLYNLNTPADYHQALRWHQEIIG